MTLRFKGFDDNGQFSYEDVEGEIMLSEELKCLADEANKVKAKQGIWDQAYIFWRKLRLTPAFYKKMKEKAEAGEYAVDVPIGEPSEEEQWRRWSNDHGLNYKDRKVWWAINQ